MSCILTPCVLLSLMALQIASEPIGPLYADDLQAEIGNKL